MNQINLNSINDRLKFIRKSKGLSQQEMADFIDVSLMSYRRYERGGKSIPHTILETITKKTDISLEFLINGKDLLKDRNETILKIKHNTQFETKIDNGDMVITARIPLFKYIGA
jgi:transcriptional regulator with XRE-family HTH domain